jgi:hypothetical protein
MVRVGKATTRNGTGGRARTLLEPTIGSVLDDCDSVVVLVRGTAQDQTRACGGFVDLVRRCPMRPPFPADALEAIAKVLADTRDGLTGSDIAHILQECRIRDTDPTMTKWRRLYNAFVHAQNAVQHGGMVVGFIHKAMKPARWRGRSTDFGDMRVNLNEALYLTGLELGEDGCLREVEASCTLSEAEKRADHLRA